jgi:hypothetical protein
MNHTTLFGDIFDDDEGCAGELDEWIAQELENAVGGDDYSPADRSFERACQLTSRLAR